jgi:hypothetical protein
VPDTDFVKQAKQLALNCDEPPSMLIMPQASYATYIEKSKRGYRYIIPSRWVRRLLDCMMGRNNA